MEGKAHLANGPAKLVLLLMFAAGLVGHSREMSRGLMLLMTPVILAIAGVVVIYPCLRSGNRRFLAWCLITLVLTYSIEYLGVTTGAFFGSYAYGGVLGFKLFEVPLVIGLNWMLVILGAISLARKGSEKVFFTAIITGCLAVAFDLILEPVAIALDYWRWEEGTPPLQNYCTWFLVGFSLSTFYGFIKAYTDTDLPRYYFYLQMLFFLMLNILI